MGQGRRTEYKKQEASYNVTIIIMIPRSEHSSPDRSSNRIHPPLDLNIHPPQGRYYFIDLKFARINAPVSDLFHVSKPSCSFSTGVTPDLKDVNPRNGHPERAYLVERYYVRLGCFSFNEKLNTSFHPTRRS